MNFLHPLGISSETLRLVLGILCGVIFGIILVKTELVWRKTWFDQFELKTFEVVKLLFFSLAAGLILFYLASKIELVRVNFRPGCFWGAVMGAIFTGLGIAVCGLFPCTAITSLGTGRIYAIWVILGMFTAISLVDTIKDWLADTIYSWSPWIVFHTAIDEYVATGDAVVWLSIFCIITGLLLYYVPAEPPSDSTTSSSKKGKNK